MIKSKGRRITWFVLTLILAMGMVGSSVFAAVPVETQGDGDNTTKDRMAQSSHIAEITMDKCFEVLEGATTVTSFDYIIEKISFWDNSNVSTSENGTGKTRTDMPAPMVGTTVLSPMGSAGDAAYQYSTSIGVTEETSETDKTSGNNGDNARTGVLKTYGGKTVVKFDFQRPGYYVYKFTEVNKKESGVKYDDHTYYLAFYVANKTKDGKATGETDGGKYGANENVSDDADKLYVHTITAWRSQATDGTNTQLVENVVIPKSVDPSFKTSNQYYLLVLKGQEDKAGVDANRVATGKKFAAVNYNATTKTADELAKNAQGECTATPMTEEEFNALANDAAYWIEVDQALVDQAIQRGEIGKVDRSKVREGNEGEEVGPNKLPINWWNESDAKDITVLKKVTGTLGDLNKEFVFTVELKNLISADGYLVEAIGGADLTKATGLTEDNKVKGTPDAQTKKYDKTFTVKLKANQSIKIVGLPIGATYKVTEAESDHVAKVNVTSANAEVVGKTPVIETGKTTNGTVSNTQSGKTCETALETVDADDGAVTITYTNHRDIETETGIPGYVFPIVLAAMIALIGLAAMRRRNNVSSVNDFEF